MLCPKMYRKELVCMYANQEGHCDYVCTNGLPWEQQSFHKYNNFWNKDIDLHVNYKISPTALILDQDLCKDVYM